MTSVHRRVLIYIFLLGCSILVATATEDTTGFSISGGPSPNEGNVFYNDAPICDDHWDNVDALVFCRMFGYQDGTATHGSKYGSVSSHFSMDDVLCNGNEDSLRDCSYITQENCDHSEGAGVICSGGGTVLIHTDAKYEYYKVPVPASSKMLSAVIVTTCSNFGFTPQCENANYADDNCVQEPDTSFDVQHPWAMSKILCNTMILCNKILCNTTDPRGVTFGDFLVIL